MKFLLVTHVKVSLKGSQSFVEGDATFTSLIGWSVYPGFIPAGNQIVRKTYMTRVEEENTGVAALSRKAA